MTAVSYWPVLATLAVAIVLGLSAWALRLQVRLLQQRAAATGNPDGEGDGRCAERHAEARRDLTEQLHRLAQVALAGDVNLSEACIRARYLLDHLDPAQAQRSDFAGIYQHYEAISGFAVRSARAALSPLERRRQDRAREALEVLHADSVQEAMQAVLKLAP